jgi:hypothetical protein
MGMRARVRCPERASVVEEEYSTQLKDFKHV